MGPNAKGLQDRSKGGEIAFGQDHGPNSFFACAVVFCNGTANVTCFILYSKQRARKPIPAHKRERRYSVCRRNRHMAKAGGFAKVSLSTCRFCTRQHPFVET